MLIFRLVQRNFKRGTKYMICLVPSRRNYSFHADFHIFLVHLVKNVIGLHIQNNFQLNKYV